MSANRGAVLFTGVFVLLSACAPEQESEPLPTGAWQTSEAAQLWSSRACPNTRYIGVWLNPGSCTGPLTTTEGTWLVKPLFPGAANVPGLAGYCSYEWQPAAGSKRVDTTPVQNLPFPANSGLRPDCQVVAPLAGTLTGLPVVSQELRSKTLRMADALGTLPGSATSQAATRVAVVDSTVNANGRVGPPGQGTYKHGHSVGSLIRMLSCPQEGSGGSVCAGWVSNHLAMPQLDETTTDWANGGFFGTQSQLASAIYDAVREWKSSAAASPNPQLRLVVNLSLGWDNHVEYGGEYAPGQAETLPAPVRAVNAAITYASCHGALIVAAAGNKSGEGQPRGPTYPAAWENIPAPTVGECEKFLTHNPQLDPVKVPGNLPVRAAAPQYRPLVHAVGGVDGRDMRLANTRELGRPRLAAYGLYVASHTPSGGPADVMSGTSMSAAMVSGIAATLWAYRPNLTPEEVMNRIYNSGLPLKANGADIMAEYPLDTLPKQGIRRVSLCRALKSACSYKEERCPAVPPTCPGTVPAHGGSNPTWSDTTWTTMVFPIDAAKETAPDYCRAASCVTASGRSRAQLAEPWVGPQPPPPVCDACSMRAQQFDAAIHPSLPPWEDASLRVETDNASFFFPLGSVFDATSAERDYVLTGLPFDASTVKSASVSFLIDGVTFTEPVLTP